MHYCSQLGAGYSGIPLERYSARLTFAAENLTKKACAPYCTIGCVHQASIVDRWRDPQIYEFASPPKALISIAPAPKSGP